MFYFAQLESREDPEVIKVYLVSEANCKNDKGEFDEKIGIRYLMSLFRNSKTVWVQTYEDPNIRGPFAAPLDRYDFETERFIPRRL